MVFNERVKMLRSEAQWSQAQMADAIGIATRNYQRLERDGGKPHYDNLLKIADYFNVSVDWLMGRTDKREVNR